MENFERNAKNLKCETMEDFIAILDYLFITGALTEQEVDAMTAFVDKVASGG